MREKATKVLLDYLATTDLDIISVAVVGGTSLDPEVAQLKAERRDVIFSYYGIENPQLDENFEILDLNQKFMSTKKYDLVLCSQVLEHVWNLNCAFDTLVSLVSNKGLLWINCPASNMPHGSPAYYSAGFSPEFLERNLITRGHQIILTGAIGSKRYYFMTHILRYWATEGEHLRPISKYNFQPGTKLGVARKFLVDLPGRLTSVFFSSKITDTVDFATESYSLSRFKDPEHL
jgi:SAM-dependent methyltransferase